MSVNKALRTSKPGMIRLLPAIGMLLLGLLLSAARLAAQPSAAGAAYVNAFKNLAIAEELRSGIPASITLAQGIHESECGNSELCRQSNNHFGIKCKEGWTGGTVYHDDDARGECFRSYVHAEDSYRDHSDFLANSSRYAFLFKLDPTDYEGWAYGLRKAGYATNIKYSQILIKLIKDYNLQQYTLMAIGKIKPTDEVALNVPGADGLRPASMPSGGDIAMNTNNGNAASNNGTGAALDGANGSGRGGPAVTGVPSRTEPSPAWPAGEFSINKTRVIFARAGVSLLSIADQYDIPLARLLDFNDLKQDDILVRDQLLFLQRKRRTGSVEFHVVREGETLYDISQAEGVRYRDLLDMNQLNEPAQPAPGEKIWLQGSAPTRPRLLATVTK